MPSYKPYHSVSHRSSLEVKCSGLGLRILRICLERFIYGLGHAAWFSLDPLCFNLRFLFIWLPVDLISLQSISLIGFTLCNGSLDEPTCGPNSFFMIKLCQGVAQVFVWKGGLKRNLSIGLWLHLLSVLCR